MRDVYIPPQRGERLPVAYDQPDEHAPDQVPGYPFPWFAVCVGLLLWAIIGVAVALLALR